MIDYYEPNSTNQEHFLDIISRWRSEMYVFSISEKVNVQKNQVAFRKQKPGGKVRCTISMETGEKRRKKAENKECSNH